MKRLVGSIKTRLLGGLARSQVHAMLDWCAVLMRPSFLQKPQAGAVAV